MEKILKGVSSSTGLCMGKAYMYRSGEELDIKKIDIEDIDYEIKRFKKSVDRAKKDISRLCLEAKKEIGEEKSKIFYTHKMILEDADFLTRVEKSIRENNINAEWAIKSILNEYINIFNSIEDVNMKEKIIDIKDVFIRVINYLMNITDRKLNNIDEKVILVAKELRPSDTIDIDKNKILAIVTEKGGLASHTSIIAKTLGIPSIVGIENLTEKVNHLDYLIVDGYYDTVIVNPTKETKKEYSHLEKEVHKYTEKHVKYINKKAITKDDISVKVLGNIATCEDSKRVVDFGGEGSGLVRTEFLYMRRESPPDYKEQVEIYSKICQNFKGKEVIIRTLDVGGDKDIPYLNFNKEKNPFLGYRGIRICLNNIELFKEQIKAIYSISSKYNIKIMFPMISSLEEIDKIDEVINLAKKELDKEEISYNKNIKKGIMIETPGAALQVEDFLKRVDFISIGTNDLVQYVLAVDRENQAISDLYSNYHPAVLRLINNIIKAGNTAGKEVGMCGEMASDRNLIPLLLAMGLRNFSVAPAFIPECKYVINHISVKKINKNLEKVLSFSRGKEVKEYLMKKYKGIYNN